jgi:hypothetical protein
MLKSIDWHLWGPVGATIVAAIIGGIFVVLAKKVPEKRPSLSSIETKGEIVQPKTGQTVERKFQVSGSLNNVPPEYHVWIAVEINTLLWFKEPEIHKSDKKWSVTITENGNSPNGVLSIILILVSPEGQKIIKNWFSKGLNTGDYPGFKISEIPGASRLDIVNGLKIN